MSFESRRRHASLTLDASRRGGIDPYAAEETLLGEIAAALEGMGERATIRRAYGGPPFLRASGIVAQLNEEITTARKGDRVCALWSWREELPDDPRQAAAAIRRVINPDA